MQITEALITLNTNPRDKEHAMQLLVESLAAAGKVELAYLEGMKQREQQENTYLGHGVAIPHGTPDSRVAVKETAVAVLHVPEGLSWGAEGELAYVIVGIAALGDEHLTILRRLTRLLNQPEQRQQLLNNPSKALIMQLLNEQSALAGSLEPIKPSNLALEFGAKVTIPNPQGMHARPASQLARLAKQLGGKIALIHADGRRADPRKMIEILSLGLTQGTVIRVETDNRESLKQLLHAIESGLGDTLEAPTEAVTPSVAFDWQPEGEIERLLGVSAGVGLALGTARHWQRPSYTLPLECQSALLEAEALDRALDTVLMQLQNALTHVAEEHQGIFHAQQALVHDMVWLKSAAELIARGKNAAQAYYHAAERYIQSLPNKAHSNNASMNRVQDIMDVRDDVVRALLGIAERDFSVAQGTVLCAQTLTPSEVVRLNPQQVAGIVLAQGHAHSHVALLAHSKGLPLVVALGAENLQRIPEGASVVLDARAGTLYLHPNSEQQAAVMRLLQAS